MSKMRKSLVAIGLAAVAVAIVIVVLLHDDSSDVQDTEAVVTAEVFTEEDAEYLEEKLNSPSKEEQALALVPMMRTGEWDGDSLFPEGSVLEIDHTSLEGDEKGHVVRSQVIQDGRVLDTYALYIVYDESEGKWLIGGTTKIEGE